MTRVATIGLFLITTITFSQENGSIRGTIAAADGSELGMVAVGLKDTKKGTLTSTSGDFQLTDVPPGEYVLYTSLMGFNPVERKVIVEAGKTADVGRLILTEAHQRLDEILIRGQRHNPYQRKESTYVAKLPLTNLENPQVYNTITAELLKDQVVTNFDDALKNAPGVEKLWESTGRGGDGAGYYSLRGFEVQPTLVNGLPGLTNGSLDPANIERIEVLKGPSGTLYGSSLISYGGLINTVTKRPNENFAAAVAYVTGSFGLHRATADFNTPVHKKLLIRVNAAYHHEKSFQDYGFQESFFLAPTLLFKPNDRFELLVMAEGLHGEGTNPTMLFLNRSSPLQFANLEALNYDPALSLTSNDITVATPRLNLQAVANYKLSEKWTSQTAITRGSAHSEGYYSYLWDNWIDKGEFSLFISDQDSKTSTTDIQQNFIGEFRVKQFRNRIVLGLDYLHLTAKDHSSAYAWFHDVTPQGEVNYDDPYSDAVAEPRSLTRDAVASLLSTATRNNSTVKNQSFSAYVLDVIDLTSSFSVLTSVRLDYFDTPGDIEATSDDYSQFAVSPKFGLVYQVVPQKFALFSNYMNGFKNVAPRQVADADGQNTRVQSFKPERANQFEFGVKADLFKSKFSPTISYYHILVTDKLMADAQNIYNTVQGGEVESQGIEISISANPARGLNLIGGYTYNRSKTLKGDAASAFGEVGKRPAEAGPANVFNAWATYTFSEGFIKNFGFGLGMNGASERIIMDSELTGRFVLPAYTTFSSSLFYDAERFRITLKADNLTDEEYYKGWTTINPQRPRSFSGSLAWKF